jgi:hypothetical protein
MVYNIPPTRYTPISPYPEFTQKQLDMRRKVEILKYSNNTSSTKTNNLTKSEKWAQLVNGNYQRRTFSNDLLNTITNGDINTVCSKKNILTPTSSCDVPGPVIYLYEDPDVILYNYATNTKAYGIIDYQNKSQWKSYFISDAFCPNSYFTQVASLNLLNVVYTSKHFSMKVPIFMYISDTLINPSTITTINGILQEYGMYNIKIFIESISLEVQYNGQNVALNTDIQYQWEENTQLYFDISYNTTNTTYYAGMYMGYVTVSNIYLQTQSSYVYDFLLNFTINGTVNGQSSYYPPYMFSEYYKYFKMPSTPVINIYSNYSANNASINPNYNPETALYKSINTIIKSVASTTPNTGFILY